MSRAAAGSGGAGAFFLPEGLDHPDSNLGRHRRATFGHLPYRVDNALRRRGFQQVAAGACANGFENPRIVPEYGEHYGRDGGMAPAEQSDALDSVEPGQTDVDQNHSRRVEADALKRGFHRVVDMTAFETGYAAQQERKPLAKLLLVLYDANADGFHDRFWGTPQYSRNPSLKRAA